LPEHYEKSNLNINGTFDEAVKVFFKKSPEKQKGEDNPQKNNGVISNQS